MDLLEDLHHTALAMETLSAACLQATGLPMSVVHDIIIMVTPGTSAVETATIKAHALHLTSRPLIRALHLTKATYGQSLKPRLEITVRAALRAEAQRLAA